MTTAHGQLRSFVDRVLNLKKQQDALGEDIKQVYSEAHAARFDKTAMGKVVNHLRRHAKAGTKAQIADATFDEYLFAYEHGTELANNSSGAHPHAGEAEDPRGKYVKGLGWVKDGICEKYEGGPVIALSDPPHDPTTGELIDDVPAIASAPGAKGLPLNGDVAGASGRFGGDASPTLSQSVVLALPVVTDAPVEQSPPPDVAPGAPPSGEMPDLPDFLDRRSAA